MTGWKSSTGVSDDTEQVQLYTPKSHKQDWQQEAEQRNDSMSSYLQDLIQEARFLREQGQLQIGDRRQVEQLQNRIEELESQTQQTPDPDHAQQHQELVTTGIVQDVISDSYQPLDHLVTEVLEHPDIRGHIKRSLEAELYRLGEHGQTAFRRGNGWKQITGGDQ